MKKQFVVLLFSLACASCYFSSTKPLITAGKVIQMEQLPGECPYLTKDNHGNTVLSWIRIINDSTTAFCYAIKKGESDFSGTVVIPGSSNIQPHGENMPKIIFKPSGEIIALWGARNPTPKNKYSGLIFYTQSFDQGKSWSAPRLLINDTASFDQRYYDVALLPDGEVGMVWLDNRKTINSEGSALYFMKTNGAKGFDGKGQLISQPCCPCCRTKMLVDKNGNIHAIYRGILENSIRDMVHIVSTDGGKTFSAPERISADNWVLNGCPHTGPSMTENMQGIHFTWFTGGKSRGSYYAKSTDNGASFMMKDSVSVLASHPQITTMPSGELVLAWEEAAAEGAKLVKRIGVQLRAADGLNKGKSFISDPTGSVSFPVLSPLSEREFVVAYTKQVNDKAFIAYQKITIE